MFTCIIVTTFLLTWVPCSSLSFQLDPDDINGNCQKYHYLRLGALDAHKNLTNLNGQVNKKLNQLKQLQIRQNSENLPEKALELQNKLEEHLALQQSAYPIYKISPFKEYSEEYAGINNHYLTGSSIPIIQCLIKLKSSHQLIERLEQGYKASLNYLKLNNKIYQYLNRGSFANCYLRDLDPKLEIQMVDGHSFTESIKRHISELERLLKNQYTCDHNPISKGQQIYDEREGLYDKFYHNMTKSLKPFLDNYKVKMQTIASKCKVESFQTYLKDASSKQSDLQNMNIHNFNDDNVNEAQELLTSAEGVLFSMKSYLSKDLSSKLTHKIQELRTQLESSVSHNANISTNLDELSNINKSMENLSTLISEVVKQCRPISETALNFKQKIDDIKIQIDIRKYVFAGNELHLEMEKFLKDTYDHLDRTLNGEINKIDNLVSEFRKNSKLLENNVIDLKLKKQQNLDKYQSIKSDLDVITSKEIPEYIKNLNNDNLNKKFNLEDPTNTLNQIDNIYKSLLKSLISYESKINDIPLTDVEDISHAVSTINQVRDENDKFQLVVSGQKSSLVKSAAKIVTTMFQSQITLFNGEFNGVNSKVNDLKSKIVSTLSNINSNKISLEEIHQRVNKMKDDYSKIINEKDNLSNQLSLSLNDFESLIATKMQNLNFNIETDITKLKNDIETSEKVISAVKDDVDQISDDIENITSLKSMIVEKSDNIKDLQSNMIESIKHGLEFIQTKDLTEFKKLVKQLKAELIEYKETIRQNQGEHSINKEYNTKFLTTATKIVREIKEINKIKLFDQQLKDNLSVDNNSKDINDLLNDVGQLIETSGSNLNDFEKKYDDLLILFDSSEQNLNTTIHEIENLLKKYNVASLEIFNDETVSSLKSVNSDLMKKYNTIKSLNETIYDQTQQMKSLATSSLTEEIKRDVKIIETKSKQIETEKKNNKDYLKKLNSMKEVAKTIKKTFEVLEEKKSKLINFLDKSLTEYNQQLELTKGEVKKLQNSSDLENENLRKLKTELTNKFDEYVQSHEGNIKTANDLNLDLPDELTNEFIQIKAIKTTLEMKFDEQLELISANKSNGETHYEKETKYLQEDYSARKAYLHTLLEQIESISNKVISITSVDMAGDIDGEYNTVVKSVDDILEEYKKGLKFTSYDKIIKGVVPDFFEEFKTNIDVVIKKENNLINKFKNNKKSEMGAKKIENKKMEHNFAEEFPNPEIDTTIFDTSKLDAVSGESKNIASKDYFKIIISVGAVALVALIVGGAFLRYRSIKRNSIYNKAEEIYVKP